MIKTTIQINDESLEFDIPTGHGELTYKQYALMKDADLQNKTLDEKLSARTGIPVKMFCRMRLGDAQKMILLTGFADFNIEMFEQSKTVQKHIRKINVGRGTYGQLEKSRQLMNGEAGFYTAMADVVKIYTDQEIIDQKVIDVYAYVSELLTQLQSFFKKYERLTGYKPGEDEIEAGIEILEQFGSFSTVISLARQLSKTYDEVMQMKADEVYMTLLYDFEENEVKKKLSDIKKRDYVAPTK